MRIRIKRITACTSYIYISILHILCKKLHSCRRGTVIESVEHLCLFQISKPF